MEDGRPSGFCMLCQRDYPSVVVTFHVLDCTRIIILRLLQIKVPFCLSCAQAVYQRAKRDNILKGLVLGGILGVPFLLSNWWVIWRVHKELREPTARRMEWEARRHD